MGVAGRLASELHDLVAAGLQIVPRGGDHFVDAHALPEAPEAQAPQHADADFSGLAVEDDGDISGSKVRHAKGKRKRIKTKQEHCRAQRPAQDISTSWCHPSPQAHKSHRKENVGISRPDHLPRTHWRPDLNRIRVHRKQRIAGARTLVHWLLFVLWRNARDSSVQQSTQCIADFEFSFLPFPAWQ
ncbi:hypothetical protein FQZ97_912830 [compost metagenome]